MRSFGRLFSHRALDVDAVGPRRHRLVGAVDQRPRPHAEQRRRRRDRAARVAELLPQRLGILAPDQLRELLAAVLKGGLGEVLGVVDVLGQRLEAVDVALDGLAEGVVEALPAGRLVSAG